MLVDELKRHTEMSDAKQLIESVANGESARTALSITEAKSNKLQIQDFVKRVDALTSDIVDFEADVDDGTPVGKTSPAVVALDKIITIIEKAQTRLENLAKTIKG